MTATITAVVEKAKGAQSSVGRPSESVEVLRMFPFGMGKETVVAGTKETESTITTGGKSANSVAAEGGSNDGNQEHSSGQALRNIDFRKPREESYADWKIIIRQEGQADKVFHAHRAVLCAGSDVFRKEILATDSVAAEGGEEIVKGVSVLTEDELAASCFVRVLEFMYGFKTAPSVIDAPVLYYWGKALGSNKLANAARTTWEYALQERKNVAYIYKCGVELADKELLEEVYTRCTMDDMDVEIDSEMMAILDVPYPGMLKNVLRDEGFHGRKSEWVAYFCSKHSEDADVVNHHIVKEMTMSLKMVKLEVIPQLSAVARRVFGTERTMSAFDDLCMEVIAKNVEKIDWKTPESAGFRKMMKGESAAFLEGLFLKTMVQCQEKRMERANVGSGNEPPAKKTRTEE